MPIAHIYARPIVRQSACEYYHEYHCACSDSDSDVLTFVISVSGTILVLFPDSKYNPRRPVQLLLVVGRTNIDTPSLIVF